MKNMESSSSRDADECLKSWKLDSIKIECSDSSNAEDCIERTSEDASCVEQLTSCFGSTKVEPVDSCDFNSPDSFPSEETVYLGSNRISTVEHLIDEKGKIINRKDMNISGGEPVVSNYDVKLEGDLIKEEISFDETYIEDSKIFTKEFWKTEDGTFSNHCVSCSSKKELQENLCTDDNPILEANICKCQQLEYGVINRTDSSRHIVDDYQEECVKFDSSTTESSNIDLVTLENKDFKCNMCNYSAKYKCRLQHHFDCVHLKAKNHKCQICEFATAYKRALKLHIEVVHLKLNQPKENCCQMCDYSTPRKSDLKVHIKAVHLKGRDYVCTWCKYACDRKQDLQRHINRRHALDVLPEFNRGADEGRSSF